MSTSDDDYVVLSYNVYLMMPLAVSNIMMITNTEVVKYGLFQNTYLENGGSTDNLKLQLLYILPTNL
jgi:hypothetical protein